MQAHRSASDSHASRPSGPLASKSFTRMEPSRQNPFARSRANTLQTGTIPEILYPRDGNLLSESEEHDEKEDVFASKEEEIMTDGAFDDAAGSDMELPQTLDDLPIEIKSLTERFLESLSAKVHPTPLTIDTLSEMFQEFYTRADSHIATHIATLSSRLSRERSPAPSISSKTSTTSKGGGRKESPSESPSGREQQMLTASEIVDRKKARRLLDVKRAALEEAVERAVCEKVYDRIWRHRSTDDEERDQKLRSRTAALGLVGIRLKELLVNADDLAESDRQKTVEKDDEIRGWLAGARENIQQMNDERYPLGKLQHLTAAHKSIVETLSQLFPASSSADEILPTLIYALITSPPEHINVVSNLNFIQRFRAASKIDGEAAYCLVNLEAAISFLETVDLSSLRADEPPEGPDKTSSRPSTPRSQSSPMKLGISPAPDPRASPILTSTDTTTTSAPLKPLPTSPTRPQRRFSHLIQAQTTRIEAASDSFRGAVLDGADQAFDSINATLENSLRFLFGRLKEQQQQRSSDGDTILPKTLADARKLVSTPPPLDDDRDDAASISAASSVAEPADTGAATEDARAKTDGARGLDVLVGGRRRPPARDRSVDSARSGGSGKRVAFAEKKNASAPSVAAMTSTTAAQPSTVTAATPSPAATATAAVESVRSFSQSLNPLKGFAGMGLFGRGGGSGSGASTPAAVEKEKERGKQLGVGAPATTMTNKSGNGGGVGAGDGPGREKAEEVLRELRKAGPPVGRFVECKDAKDLRVGEVEELLREYQRLAGVLKGVLGS